MTKAAAQIRALVWKEKPAKRGDGLLYGFWGSEKVVIMGERGGVR